MEYGVKLVICMYFSFCSVVFWICGFFGAARGSVCSALNLTCGANNDLGDANIISMELTARPS